MPTAGASPSPGPRARRARARRTVPESPLDESPPTSPNFEADGARAPAVTASSPPTSNIPLSRRRRRRTGRAVPAAATAEDSPPPRATPAAQAPPPTTQASPAMHQDCMAEDRLAVALKVRAKVLKNGATAKEILTAPRGAMKTAARFDARGLKTRLNFFSLLLHPDKHAGVRRSLHRSTGTFVPAVAGERPAIAPRLPRDCPRTFPAHAIARALRHALTLCPARRGALLRRRAQVSDAETALWTNAFDKVKSAYDELVAATMLPIEMAMDDMSIASNSSLPP